MEMRKDLQRTKTMRLPKGERLGEMLSYTILSSSFVESSSSIMVFAEELMGWASTYIGVLKIMILCNSIQDNREEGEGEGKKNEEITKVRRKTLPNRERECREWVIWK